VMKTKWNFTSWHGLFEPMYVSGRLRIWSSCSRSWYVSSFLFGASLTDLFIADAIIKATSTVEWTAISNYNNKMVFTLYQDLKKNVNKLNFINVSLLLSNSVSVAQFLPFPFSGAFVFVSVDERVFVFTVLILFSLYLNDQPMKNVSFDLIDLTCQNVRFVNIFRKL
jgi:hypothetical protein